MATVLFLHAFPLHGRMWDRQREAVEAAGHQALCPDLPGFGATPSLEEPSIEAFARHVLGCLDAAGVDRVVVCGLSMGGYVALRLFDLAPERFAGLLLADTRADADAPEARARRHQQIARIQSEGKGWLSAELLPLLLSEGASEEVREQVRTLIDAASATGVIGALQAMAERPDSTPLLKQVDVPAATVAGERDQLTPPSIMRPMASQLAGSVCTGLAGVGHLSCLEAPTGFNRALFRLLDRVSRLAALGGAV